MQSQANPEALPAEPNDEPAGRPIPRDPDALLYPLEAAYLLGLSNRTLEAARLKGGLVRFCRLSRRAVRYRRQDILDYITSRLRNSTSDPGPSDEAGAGTPAEG